MMGTGEDVPFGDQAPPGLELLWAPWLLVGIICRGEAWAKLTRALGKLNVLEILVDKIRASPTR